MSSEPPGRRAPIPSADAILDRALEFLDLVYEAAESPSALQSALALLSEIAGAPSVLLLATEGGERRLVAAAHAASAPANDAGSVQLRSDRVRTIPLSRGLELVVDPGLASTPHPAQEILLLRLAPHLARALRISERHAHDEEGGQQDAARLDRLSLAVALLDSDGQIVHLNRVARMLIGAATSIEVEHHRFVIRHAATRVLFEALVERVAAPPDPERRFVGGRLTVADGQWGRVDLLVAPFAVRVAQASVAAGVVLSARAAAPSPEERLRDLCALTEEEARIAIDVVAGRGRDEDPDREATEATLRSLYRKLGTTRQADLLRLVLRPPGVVFDSAASRSRAI